MTMETDSKILLSLFVSIIFSLIIFSVSIFLVYQFIINASTQTSQFIQDIPLDKILSVGGVSSVLYYIKKKYK